MPILYDNGPKLHAHEFRILRELINQHAGMHFDDASAFVVERRLRDRLKALGLDSFAQYATYLADRIGNPPEIENAVEALVTNETYFFREEYQLRAFREDLMPLIRERARERDARRITIWSAGCSTGEEVYTIAILLSRSKIFESCDVRVVGSDISRRVLSIARNARYSRSSFRAMPEEYNEYFVPDGDGMRVASRIRSMCQFLHLNLLDRERASILGRVDAIFCRNVLIYFDSESRQRVIEHFYDRLMPGGYLLLGHSESLLNASTSFELAHLSSDLVYRKPVDARFSRPVRQNERDSLPRFKSESRPDSESREATATGDARFRGARLPRRGPR